MNHLVKFLCLCLTLGLSFNLKAQNKKEKALCTQAYKHLSIHAQYKYGGSDNIEGFDGSGFIQHIYKQALGIQLKRRSVDQASQGRKINLEEAQIGDLLFFSGSKVDNQIQQVGIVVKRTENDLIMIYAGNSKGVTKTPVLSSKYWKKRFIIAKTIIH
jgi:cell wall-associated NlpC family hydrolase